MNDGVAAGFDPPVIGVGGLASPGDPGLRIGEPGFDVPQRGRPVGLQGDQLVAAAFEDDPGGFGVAMDGVGGHKRPFGTVVNLVLGAIVTPMEGAYGNQEGHIGSASGRA